METQQTFKPKLHFTPEKNWINDPNGLIYLDGKYHIFFQYNPDGDQWGNISWGHASSADLINWEEHPVAIPSETGEMIFSGTTVFDKAGKAGFGRNCLIAVYTSFFYETDRYGELIPISQSQSLAYSLDGGYTFTKYAGNPVLDIGSTEFRDPKVFWYEPRQRWIMVISLADQHKVAIYQSKDLKTWKKTSEFGPLGNAEAVWECPDLFEVSVIGEEEKKWVLTLSAGGAQKGQLGMQYFVGEFDGERFLPTPGQASRILDWGNDFYAGITFANMPDTSRVLMLAWVNSHHYARFTPTQPWRGALSLPRRLCLKKHNKEYKLFQWVDRSIESRGKRVHLKHFVDLNKDKFRFPDPGRSYLLKLSIENKDAIGFGLKMFVSNNEEVLLVYKPEEEMLLFDRSRTKYADLHWSYTKSSSYPLRLPKGKLNLKIWVDHCVVEVFLNDGDFCCTHQVFTAPGSTGLYLFSEGGGIEIQHLSLVKF